jgi:hypothetical protein
MRESALGLEVGRNYEDLTWTVLQGLRPISTPETICALFTDSCRKYLHAETVLDVLSHPQPGDVEPQGHCSTGLLQSVQAALLSCGKSSFILNRRQLNPGLYENLMQQSGLQSESERVWLALTVTEGELRVFCAAHRPAESLHDHWTEHDVRFLDFSARLFTFLLKRSHEASRLLKHIWAPQGHDAETTVPFSKTQFEFICYICAELLNVDQVLLTHVLREANGYRIKGVFASGFGSRNRWLEEATDRILDRSNSDFHRKLDIMPYILQDSLKAADLSGQSAKIQELYSATVGDADCPFTIDD